MGSSEGVGGGAFLVAGAACDRPGVGGRGAEEGEWGAETRSERWTEVRSHRALKPRETT